MAESGLEPWFLFIQNVVLKSIPQATNDSSQTWGSPIPLGVSQESDEGEGGVSERHLEDPTAEMDARTSKMKLELWALVELLKYFCHLWNGYHLCKHILGHKQSAL